MLRTCPHQHGFTLVELLVGVAVGSIVVAGVISVFASTAGHQKTLIEAARLEKELRSLMTLMTDDLRRAGYAALMPGVDNDGDGLVDITDLTFNPFLSGETDIDTDAKTGRLRNAAGSTRTERRLPARRGRLQRLWIPALGLHPHRPL